MNIELYEDKREFGLNIQELYKKLQRTICNSEVAAKIIKNSSWLVIDKIFTMLIGMFITAVIARYFGPEEFGLFNYALAFTALFTALSTLGMETLTVKTIVDKEYDEGTILCTSFCLRVLGGITLTILSVMIIRLIEPFDNKLHILVLIMSFTMLIKSFEVIEYWIQAYQEAKISSIIRISVYLITAILKLTLVFFRGNVIHYALIYSLDGIIVGIALIISYFKIRQDKSNWKFDFSYAKNILSRSWYLILSGLMVTLYMRIDQVMLGVIMPTKTELGIYSAAVRIAEMWYFVPMALITSFKPVIMSKKKTNEESYINSVQFLYIIVSWIGIGFGIFILLFSKSIVGILYGTEYLKAATVLLISVWAGTFAMLGSARSIWLICEGLQKYTLLYTFIGLIINILLNYLVIPILGAYGAAIATLISQFIANVVVLAFFKNTRISSIMILKSFLPNLALKYKGQSQK